jgi:hypothetical protein
VKYRVMSWRNSALLAKADWIDEDSGTGESVLTERRRF